MVTRSFDHADSDPLVPEVVSQKIARVVKRTRGTLFLSGTLIAMAAALLVMLIAIGVDWALVLVESFQRSQLTFAALTSMGVLAVICFGLTTFRGISTQDAARRIDEQVPALEERWESVTEFSSTTANPELRGSEAFIRKVAEEAAQMEHIVQPTKIRIGPELIFAAGGLAAIIGLWVLAISYDPGQIAVLVQRFLSPKSDITLTQIKSESGDIILPRGSKLKLEAVLSGRVRPKAEITIRKPGTSDEIVKLDALKGEQSRFVYPIKELQEDFTYRFRSGDGLSAWHTVRIAERPVLKHADFKIVPPAYSKLPELQQDGLPKSVKALEGSRLMLVLESSIPLKSLVLQGENSIDLTVSPVEANTYRWEMELNQTFVFHPILESTEGMKNSLPPRCEILVFRDQAPVVEVASPTEEVAVKPDDRVTITFDAKDDLGVAKAELVIFDPANDGGQELKTIPIPLGDQAGEKSVHAQLTLDLKDFSLKHGEELSYAIRVYDTKNEIATIEPGRASPTQSEKRPEVSKIAGSGAKVPNESNQHADSDPNEIDSNSSVAAADKDRSDEAKNETSKTAKPNSNTAQKNDNREFGKPRQRGQSVAKNESPRNDEPKEQLEGGNTWQPKSSGKNPPENPNEAEMSGERRPDFKMAKHELDTPGQVSSSSRRRIRIDQWAGSYASQVLDKLQIEIDPVLDDLKRALGQAKDTLQPLAKQAKAANDWKLADGITVRKADDLLEAAEGYVTTLTKKTDGTPYAFIGLQLQDITYLHISPAREHLRDVTLLGGASKPDDLKGSVVHIQRAIELLEKLTKQYEAVKLDQKLAETMDKIKTMHQMFLDGTFAMLTAEKPELNPKDRAFMEFELSEEFLAKLKELLEKKLEIQAELAKILSEDPRLLQRFMARIRLEATSLRDQLTLIATRQQNLLNDVKDGLPANDDPKAKLKFKNRIARRVDSASQIAEATYQMFDNFVVWTPLDHDIDKGDFAKFKAEGVKLAATASEFATEANNENGTKAVDLGDALYDKLVEWEKKLPDLLTDPGDGKLQTHIANRLEETQKLITDISGWVLKEQSMDAGDHHLAAEVDQHRITVDTMILTRKLNSIKAQCQGMTAELATMANEFLTMMESDLVPELEESQLTLNANQLDEALKHQMAAAEQFAKAEKKLDELMDGMIKYLDAQPFDDKPEFPDGLEPESLEQLLSMLEDEAHAAEALGIPNRPSNLLLEKDWSKPGSGGGGGSGRGRAPRGRPGSQTGQSQMAAEQAERMRKKLEDALKKLKDSGEKEGDKVARKPERKWDTLGSKLEDHLRQARGNLPPEQYRKAIEKYFESLAGKSQTGPKGD